MFRTVSRQMATIYHNIEDFGRYRRVPFTSVQFYVIGSFRLANPMLILIYYSTMVEPYAARSFIFYMFGTLFIAVPFHTFMLFLGSYTRMMFLRIWKCVPLFKGFGFTMVIIYEIQIVCMQYITGFNMHLLMYKSTEGKQLTDNRDAWFTCNFEEASNVCVPMGNTSFKCEKGIIYEFGFMHYIRNVIFKSNIGVESSSLKLHANMLPMCICVWTVTAALCFIGIQKFIRVYTAMLSVTITFQFLFCTAIFLTADDLKIPLNKTVTREDTLQFLLVVFIHSTAATEIGSTVWLGTSKPENVKPTYAMLLMTFFKLLQIFTHTVMLKLSVDNFIVGQRTKMEECETETNSIMKFCIILYLFMDFAQPELWTNLFLSICTIYAFLDNLLLSSMTIDTIADAFPSMNAHRLLICIGFFAINSFASLIMMFGFAEIVFIVWLNLEVLLFGVTIYCTFGIVFNYIYTRKMLITDYVFTYNERPSVFFTGLWSAAPTISLFLVVSCCFWLSASDMFKFNTFTKTICFLVLTALFFPHVIILGKVLLTGASDEKTSVVTPDSTWGPYDPQARISRKQYILSRNQTYRLTTVSCAHTCLPKIPAFEDERVFQYTKFTMASKAYVVRRYMTGKKLSSA